MDRPVARRPSAILATILVAVSFGACDVAAPPASQASPSGAPVASSSTGADASPTPAPSPTPIPSPTPVAYIVRTGDSLTSIARRYGTTARSIAYWNRITYPSLDPDSADYAPDRIGVGWTLTVWPGQVVDEQNPPPGPSPTPRPSLSIPPFATPVPGAASLLVDHGPRDSDAVALTFDLGPETVPDPAVVGWLIDHGVPATIFTTGETGTATDAGTAVLKPAAAHPDLFTLGSRGWDGPDVTTISPTAIDEQLDRTETAVEALVGRSTRPFFRPPGGSQDLAARTELGRQGWSYTVLWDVDAADVVSEAAGGPTADDLVARVLARVQGGSIVRFHLAGPNTLAALPRIVDGLHAMGLEPVTLARLLGAG